MHAESHKSYFEDLELHFIELHQFDDEATHIKTTLDRWVAFLKKAHHYDKTTFPTELKVELTIEKAFFSLNTLSLDKEEREVYEARLKWLAALQRVHKKEQIEGKAEGKAEIAINMLKANKALDEISIFIGLSLDDIANLKNEIE